jgi:predicted ATPase with chaperone activity
MSSRPLRAFCELSTNCGRLLERAMTPQRLSACARDRILKVAPTEPTSKNKQTSSPQHIAEAIQYPTLVGVALNS